MSTVHAKKKTDLSKKGHIFLQNQNENSRVIRESYSRFGSVSVRRNNGVNLSLKLLWLPKHKWKIILDTAVKLPDDLYIDSLKDSNTDFVDETLEGRFPGSREIFREKIAHFPSVALRQISDDRLVGFFLTDHLGFANHGYVLKERRGEALGEKITALQYQEYLKDTIPYGFVLPTNTSSIQTLKKGGVIYILDDVDIEILEFTPFSQVPSKV